MTISGIYGQTARFETDSQKRITQKKENLAAESVHCRGSDWKVSYSLREKDLLVDAITSCVVAKVSAM